MRDYIAVVFDNSAKAYDALHQLWQMDHDGDVTVHGTGVVHRDDVGLVQVDTKETKPVLGTALGVGIGALLGALAGPAGAAAGAAAASAAGTGAAIGAASGGFVGLATDAHRADTRDQALNETGFVLPRGKSALIADVSEDWTAPIDTAMQKLGGKVYRRSKSSLEDDNWYGYYDYPYDYYLYPYEYIPPSYAS